LFLDNVYQTVITMTTCGFGDFVPHTRLGKIASIFTALSGGFMISLVIVSANGKYSDDF